MNAKARTARQMIRTRRTETAAAKRPHTMTSHALRAGVRADYAAGIGSALRTKAKQLGVDGCAVRMFRRTEGGAKLWREPVRGARRYTVADVAAVLPAYKPRAAKNAIARMLMSEYAA